jgi:PAS domain S-box-containing protein
MKRNDPFSWLKHQLPLVAFNKSTAQIASAIAILVGCLVLLGWSLDIAFLKSVIPKAATMKANTAVGFILAGISLGLQTRKGQSTLTTTLAQGCAIAVCIIGLLNLFQYLFNWNLGIDELLFRDVPISPNTAYPGRMGCNTALNFALIGLALWLNGQKLNKERKRRSYYVTQNATLIVAAIALLALIGYGYNVQSFYQLIFYSSSMAIHTALTFLVLCIGILSLQRNHGWLQIVTSNSLGGIVARQLIPAAFGLPLVLGWLIRQGQLAGWYDPNFGLSLMVMSLVVILLGLIGRSAGIINKIDGDRKRSSDRLRSSEARLQLALTGANQGIWDWDLKTEVLTWDDRCKKIFGLAPDFPITYEWHLNALHPDDRERVSEAGAIALREQTEFNEEYRTFYPDGTMRWILARGRGYYDETGKPYRMLGIVIDISDRKEAESAFLRTNSILQTVINGSRDVIYVKDLQGRYVLANQAAALWLNRKVESILGQDDLALFPADVARQIQTADRQVIENEEFITYEEQLLKGDEMRSLLSTKYPWLNTQSEVIGMIGISIDVTDLKQAEVDLRESEERYRFLVENTSDLVFRIGLRQPLALDLSIEQGVDWIFREAFLVAVNDGFAQAYGYERADELVGKPMRDLVPRTPENEAMVRDVVANGHRIVEARTEEVDRYGKRKVMLNSNVGRIEGGFVYDYFGTSKDITEQVIAEEALIAQEQRYRNIFESVGVSIWEEDFSEVKVAINQLKASGIKDFEGYFNEHPEFVQWGINAIRVLDVNDISLQIYGAQDKAELLRSMSQICLPETIPAFIEEFLAIAAGETFLQSETVIRNLQGKHLHILFTITFPPPNNPYDRVLVAILDISDRKRAQLNEQFLKKLDLRLRQLTDAKAMIWETVSSLGEYLNVDRCFWHEIDWENRVAIIERNWRRADVTDLAGTYPLENFFTSEQFDYLAEGQTIIVPDVTTHPHTAPYAQSYQPLTVAAFVAVPCIQLGQWVANLSINCTTVRNWRDDEVTLLQETVARLWSIIEHTRAIQALRASEYQYRTLFEIIDQGFCVCQMLFDENGEPIDYRFLEVNSVFEQMTGLQEATGKTALELVPNLENFWIQTYGRVVLTGEPARFENQSAAMNRWFNVSAFRFDEAQNNKFAVLFTNITARKQAEAELQERTDHIQILYEITRDLLSTNQPLALVEALFAKLKPLIGLDVYFNYIVDEQQQKLHLMFSGGISEETAREIEWLEIGQAICGTVTQQQCQIVHTPLATTEETSATQWLPNLQQSTDPKTELVRSLGLTAYSCQPLISQGKLFGTLGFGSFTRTEFTPAETKLFQAICDRIAIALERAEILSSLQQQTEELTKANRLKDEFLAALSHELRTPLNPILGWTKLLQTRNLTGSKTNEALSAIERNAKQQIALVDDLLDVSRVVQGQFQLTSQPVDLVPIINAAIDTVRFTAITKCIILEFHYPSDSISQVMGDKTRLQQIFWNLLSNAIKFTPDGGCIDIRLEQIQNHAQISITDTGIGISPEFLPHVFERFRQADGSSTRRYGGLGLGLALVKYLVELHGGTVSAESLGEGRGATFKVKLPLLKAETLFNSQAHSDSQQPQTNSSNSFTSGSLTGIRVLVVDDEPDNLDLVNFVLTQEGARVTAVTSAIEALTIISENPPDILLSDIGMPEMDGYELLQQVRALPSQQNNPIKAIALTAFAQQEDEEKAINAGFWAYLSKPVNLIDLVTAIASINL